MADLDALAVDKTCGFREIMLSLQGLYCEIYLPFWCTYFSAGALILRMQLADLVAQPVWQRMDVRVEQANSRSLRRDAAVIMGTALKVRAWRVDGGPWAVCCSLEFRSLGITVACPLSLIHSRSFLHQRSQDTEEVHGIPK